jgi:enoyl-CoA hydratase
MSDIVTYEARDQVAVITLNRPDARNAINGEVAEAMEAAIDRMEADDGIWVGVVQANTEGQERPVFCAGADSPARSAATSPWS